jgi:hypothetical protein
VEKIGRNDACPCGSGKKYKKCCLEKGRESTLRMRDDSVVAKQALDWLGEQYPDGVREAVFGGFLGGLKKREREAVGSLSSEIQELLNVNIGEWLLTDAKISVQGEPIAVRDILLNHDNRHLSTEGIRWLSNLGERPLSVYEVKSVEPGEGILLTDMLRPEDPDVRVRERKASRGLVRWDTLGARLVKSGNEWILSGAVYPLVREGAISCRARIQRKTKCEDSDDFREICGSAIREEWLRSVLAERENGNSYTETLQPPTVDNFEKWAEEPLSALGERSPRKAVKTPAGRRAVMELLKSFELRDARRILKEGGDPVAFGHIWEGLGLQREDA